MIRFEGLNGVVRMSADAPDAPGYARTVGDAITQLQHYSTYKILMSTSLANRIAQDQAFEPLLCFNELELEVTEISPRECTKREGIQSVLDAPPIPTTEPVYGIGDASNDVSLMNAVDVGIAMGNAPDFLKEKADYVTDSIDTTRRHRARTLWLIYRAPCRTCGRMDQSSSTAALDALMWQYVVCIMQRCNLSKNARTRVQSVYQLFSPAL